MLVKGVEDEGGGGLIKSHQPCLMESPKTHFHRMMWGVGGCGKTCSCWMVRRECKNMKGVEKCEQYMRRLISVTLTPWINNGDLLKYKQDRLHGRINGKEFNSCF